MIGSGFSQEPNETKQARSLPPKVAFYVTVGQHSAQTLPTSAQLAVAPEALPQLKTDSSKAKPRSDKAPVTSFPWRRSKSTLRASEFPLFPCGAASLYVLRSQASDGLPLHPPLSCNRKSETDDGFKLGAAPGRPFRAVSSRHASD
jgi:hypothetical protein